ARVSRQQNGADVLAMGGPIGAFSLADEILKTWLAMAFEGGRHQRRIDQIREAEKQLCAEVSAAMASPKAGPRGYSARGQGIVPEISPGRKTHKASLNERVVEVFPPDGPLARALPH